MCVYANILVVNLNFGLTCTYLALGGSYIFAKGLLFKMDLYHEITNEETPRKG